MADLNVTPAEGETELLADQIARLQERIDQEERPERKVWARFELAKAQLAAAQTAPVADRGRLKKDGSENLEAAYREAFVCISPYAPARLEIALAWATYLHDQKGRVMDAAEVAKNALDEGVADMDRLSDDARADFVRVARVLRDRVNEWLDSMDSNA